MAIKESYWWYLTIEGQIGQEEDLCSLVDLSGSIGSEINEGRDRIQVRAFFRSSQDLGFWLEKVNEAIEPWPSVHVVDSGKVENQQWHTAWKDAFPPLLVGDSFVVLAPWHRGKEPEGRIPLYIYPGSAFGTGYHESTQSALVLMERHMKKGMSVADVGTGSGILSIASLKMGAQTVYARDIDPAVKNELEHNLEINETANDRILFETASLLDNFGEKVDLLIANIVVEPLLEMLPGLSSVLLPGGLAIMSGMVTREKEIFFEVLGQTSLSVIDEVTLEDWWGVVVQAR